MTAAVLKSLRIVYVESGLKAFLHADRNVWLLVFMRAVRMLGYGFNALILALFFESLGFSDSSIGLFYTLTLLGDVALSLCLTLVADQLGRRRILLFGAGLMALSGTAFALSTHYIILLGAAVFGVISPSGNEIGPFRAIEESMLAHLTTPETRTEIMSWYVVVPAVGTSLGLLLCGNFVSLLNSLGWEARSAYQACFWLYALCGILNAGLALLMSERCEMGGNESSNSAPVAGKKPSKFSQISAESRPVLYKLGALMSVDSLSSGMAAYSLINLYVVRKFDLPESELGDIMSGIWLVSAFMNIWSAAIAKRIGLVQAMVFTHLPSAIFLALIPVPRAWWATVILLVARAAMSSMDQAPRTAFISAIVKPEERTAVMGIVNVMKILAQSGGPSITGALASANLFWVAFVLAGSLKASYDVGLLTMFMSTKVHEHKGPDYERVRQGEDEEVAIMLADEDEQDSGEDEREDAKESMSVKGKEASVKG